MEIGSSEILSVGVSLIFLGLMLHFFPSWKVTKIGISNREILINESEKAGDLKRAEALKKEIHAFRKIVPIYSKAILSAGALLTIASLLL